MHTKDAAHAEETWVRLNLVAAWREAKVFTEPERAALELAEQGTRIADAAGGVTDEVWANAAKHFDEDQLAALVAHRHHQTFNRANVIVQQPAGDYSPASSGDADYHLAGTAGTVSHQQQRTPRGTLAGPRAVGPGTPDRRALGGQRYQPRRSNRPAS